MQSCLQNITTVRYLLYLLYEPTSLDVNVFLYIVALFFGGVI